MAKKNYKHFFEMVLHQQIYRAYYHKVSFQRIKKTI